MTTEEINGFDDNYINNFLISDCCGAFIYGDSDICSDCGEHCEAIDPDTEEETAPIDVKYKVTIKGKNFKDETIFPNYRDAEKYYDYQKIHLKKDEKIIMEQTKESE